MFDLFNAAVAAADLAQIDETVRLRAEVGRLAAALHASELARLDAEISNAHLERENQGLRRTVLFQRAWFDAVHCLHPIPILDPGDVCFGPSLPT